VIRKNPSGNILYFYLRVFLFPTQMLVALIKKKIMRVFLINKIEVYYYFKLNPSGTIIFVLSFKSLPSPTQVI